MHSCDLYALLRLGKRITGQVLTQAEQRIRNRGSMPAPRGRSVSPQVTDRLAAAVVGDAAAPDGAVRPERRRGVQRGVPRNHPGGATCLNPAGMLTLFTMLTSDWVRGSHVKLPMSFMFCSGPPRLA
jgi:hypothetical protein